MDGQCWMPPDVGWLKMNVDGGVGPAASGIGGLVRESMGRWKCSFAARVQGTDTFHVELQSLHRGLPFPV